MPADLHPTLAAAPAPQVVTLHPAAVAAFHQAMADLAPILRGRDPERDRELIEATRALIDRVVIHDRDGGAVEAEVIGRIGPLCAPGMLGGAMVAEVRFPAFPQFIWGSFAA